MHHFSIQVFSFYLFLVVTGKQLNGIRVWELTERFFYWQLFKGRVIESHFVYYYGRETVLQVLLQMVVACRTRETEGVASYYNKVDVLELREEP